MRNGTLRGRHALVTGATSGIGLGIAGALAACDCDVTLNGFGEPARLHELCAELSDLGQGEIVHAPADLRDPLQIERMVRDAIGCCGHIDILVNNAGIQHVSPVETFPVDKWDEIIAVNLSAAFHTTRLVLPGMLESGWGRIVNIASAHALRASPYKSAYVAAKHGLAGLTKAVALEVAEKHITVNAIAPGYVDTPLVTGQLSDTARARGMSYEQVLHEVVLQAQPTRELVTVEQVAALVVYLCSDAAAAITGTVLPIDGGWTAR